jgi:hypothetical protein
MKKYLFPFLLCLSTGCSPAISNQEVKYIDLKPGRKLVNVKWSEDSFSYLTRNRRVGEHPEQHTFKEQIAAENLERGLVIVVVEH